MTLLYIGEKNEVLKAEQIFLPDPESLESCGFLRMFLGFQFCGVLSWCRNDQPMGENWSEVVSFCHSNDTMPWEGNDVFDPGVTDKANKFFLASECPCKTEIK